MTYFFEESSKTINLLKEITSNSQNIIKFKKIDLVIESLLEEIIDKSYSYVDEILAYLFSHLNSNLIPYFLNQLVNIAIPSVSGHKIALYLIKAESRPIYQIKGLQLVSSLKDSSFAPFIINLIFSSHKPLQQQAIRRKELAARLMKQINPDNIKLAQIMIESEDFLERIEGIKIISETGNRKWIKKIFEKMLGIEKDLAVRKAIFEAITSLGGKKAEKILQISLENEDFTPMRNLIYNSIQILKNK